MAFQKGDKVVFFQDTNTSRINNLDQTGYMERNLETQEVLTIEEVYNKESIRCIGPGGRVFAYNINDLMPYQAMSKDEQYLKNLLKG